VNIFIDTDILLDVLAERKAFYPASSRLWTLAEKRKIGAFISAISFNNIFYIVRKIAGKERAKEALYILRDIFQIVPVERDIISRALEAPMDDFEDAIQYFCARKIKANYIITRNTQDFPFPKPIPLKADEFMVLLETS